MSTENLAMAVRRVRKANRGLHTKHYQNKGDLHLLHVLDKKYPDGTTPSILAKHIGIAMPTVSLKLTQLEELGMIKRVQSSQDRRKNYIQVSEKGRVILGENFREYISDWEKICARLGDEKTEMLAQLLNELGDIITDEMGDESK